MKIVIAGLSLTSSWGNGHATTYRGLVRELVARGNEVLFLERDVPWYASHRDLAEPPYGKTKLYSSIAELTESFTRDVRDADLVMVGSYVPDGIEVGEWVTRTARGVTAFYDIDTPVTMTAIERGDCTYLTRALIPSFDLYLSFTGGPTLQKLERQYKARRARALYCSFDPRNYFPEPAEPKWDLGYLGTYAECRQPALDALMLESARRFPNGRFVVAGPQYPDSIAWPKNVERIDHLAPPDHRRFYNSQRFTLNVTRSDMVAAGYSPSVRLFEAAACGTPIISDKWAGIDELFNPGTEILIARSASETLEWLQRLTEEERRRIGERARERVLAEHTAAHRAEQLEAYVLEARGRRRLGRAARLVATTG